MKPSRARVTGARLVDIVRSYSYPMGCALVALAEAQDEQDAGREARAVERLREASLWLELELQRCARLSDNCVCAELDVLPNEMGERGRLLDAAEKYIFWHQLLRTDPSQTVCAIGTITKRAVYETLELVRARVAAKTGRPDD